MMTDPIEKTLTVPLRPQDAFDLFTDHLQDWWPLDSHSLSAADGDLPQDVTVDPREGGHITETRPDGVTGRWGTITEWAPGHALGISWHVGRDPSEATDLYIRFTPVEDGTRVDLTHGGFDRLAGAETMRANYLSGWEHVLGRCYGTYCAARAPAASGV